MSRRTRLFSDFKDALRRSAPLDELQRITNRGISYIPREKHAAVIQELDQITKAFMLQLEINKLKLDSAAGKEIINGDGNGAA